MSRIGKKPIAIPKGVTVTVDGSDVKVKGPRGELDRTVHSAMTVAVNDGQVAVTRPDDEPQSKARPYGLQLALGFSHPVEYRAPKGIKLSAPQPTSIVVEGANKETVGQVAAELRQLRPPEPYKGKGIKYVGEVIRRKAGKAGGK
jgi:large subunit ribosomal protein L6